MVVDRDFEAADVVARSIADKGGSAFPVVADVSNEADSERMASTAVERLGRIDFLFANAAVHGVGTVSSTTVEDWDEVIAVNLRGPFLSSRFCLPHMIDSGGGVIVITSSDSTVTTGRSEPAYASSKFGVIGLVRSIAIDFGADGIRANAIVPGVTDTPGLRQVFSAVGESAEEAIKRAASLSPLGRIGAADEVAEAVVFLCSNRASLFTGATIVVDGGMTITYGGD